VTTPDGAPGEVSDLVAESEGDDHGNGDGNKPLPLQLELPSAKLQDAAVAEVVAERSRSGPAPVVRIAAATLAALVLIAAIAVAVSTWGLPAYVRRQCIEMAASRDIDLQVDAAKLDAAGFHLIGVRATFVQIPGARGHALMVDVQTRAMRPHSLTIHGAELALSGPSGQIVSDFARWRASLSNAPAAPWDSARWIVEGARVVWRAPAVDGVRLEALDVNAELKPTELHARSDHVTVAVAQGVFGPWRVDADRLPMSSRIRVALDPGVPEACTILVVGDSERITSVDVTVPRSPLEHLGIPRNLVGGFDTSRMQLETEIHYAALGPTRAEVRATGSLHDVELAFAPRPIEIAWEATMGGDADVGIDVKKAWLAVGPLVGPLSGMLKRFEDGFRVDLAWAAGPIPCDAFAVPLGLGRPFDIDYALRKLAEASRISLHHGAGMTGTVSASVMISLDSRDPTTTKIDFVPQASCQGRRG
jgi:hypothetical protein